MYKPILKALILAAARRLTSCRCWLDHLAGRVVSSQALDLRATLSWRHRVRITAVHVSSSGQNLES